MNIDNRFRMVLENKIDSLIFVSFYDTNVPYYNTEVNKVCKRK
jgi:hypothetical protein